MTADKVRVCLISGGFNFRLEILGKIKSFLKKHESHSYGKETVAEYIEQQVLSVNLFDTTRLVVLTSIPVFGSGGAKSKDRIKKIIENIPENCVVVFNGIDKGKRTEWLFKLVRKIGKIYESPQYITKSSAINYVEKSFDQDNKKIEEGSAEFLISIIGEVYKKGVDVDKLYLSLKKLHSFTAGNKEITKSDILKTSDQDKEYIMWKLFENMDKRDYVGCLNVYRKARDLVRLEKDSAMQILNNIRWRYRLLLFLKESKKLGYENEKILDDISGLKKLKRSGSGHHAIYDFDKTEDKEEKIKTQYSMGMAKNMLVGNYGYESAISKYNFKEIYNILLSVTESLFKIRSCCNDAEVALAVDNVFMTSCGVVNTKVLTSLRRPHV